MFLFPMLQISHSHIYFGKDTGELFLIEFKNNFDRMTKEYYLLS